MAALSRLCKMMDFLIFLKLAFRFLTKLFFAQIVDESAATVMMTNPPTLLSAYQHTT
jgi:hypothetical protein